MASGSGNVGLSDTRGNKNIVAQIAQLSWQKVKSAEKMAGAEKKYAKKKLRVGEEGGLTQKEFSQKFGRGSFFKKALGSQFGGDKIARNRGRVESFFDKDVPGGRDATKSRQGRYREGFDYSGVEPKDAMVGKKPKTEKNKEEGEKKSSRSSRAAINEAMASALAGIEIQLTKLSEKFTNTVSVPEGLTEIINKQSQVITSGFDGLSKALYTLLGSIQKQTATMVRLDQEQKNLDAKNLDRQQALDEENALENLNGGAGNVAVKDFGKSNKGGKGGGILGRMFGLSALARRIGKRGFARAGVRAAAAVGGKGAAKFMTKGTAKAFAKAGLKSGLKKIPLLGLGIGALFAAQRAMSGDTIGAGLELASGAASLVPGAGTAASLGVDGIIAARDAGAIPFAKGGMVTKPTLGVVGEGKDPELITPWNKKTFDMMNKARLDAIQRNKNKFADVQAKGLEEYYENMGGWQKFGETLITLLKGAGFNPDDVGPGPNGDPDLTPVDLKGFSKEDVSLLGKMLFAEAGSGGESTAHVMNSILNRYREIKSGRASPSSWGIQGKEAKDVTLKDILYADGQYTQSLPKLSGITDAQGTASLNAAISSGGLDPSKIYENARTSGMSEIDAKRLATADTYYNPTISSNKPFPGAPVVNTANNHAFMSSPNVGFRPSDLDKLKAVEQKREQPPAPIPKTDWAAKITQNFGYSEGEKLFFTGPDNVSYHAVRKSTGWEIYKGGIGGYGGTYMETTGDANKSLEPYLMRAGQEKMMQSRGNDQASVLSQKSQEVAMARTGGPQVQVSVINNNEGNRATIPKSDSAMPSSGRDAFVPLSLDQRSAVG